MLIGAFAISCMQGYAQEDGLVYTREDSLTVMRLLHEVPDTLAADGLTLHFSRCLTGVPYVAGTLEAGATEPLVVNLREMDCMTLVENVLALSFTYRSGVLEFERFCSCLQRLRYRYGRRDGYLSRNHYFSQWISSNERLGLVRELTSDDAGDGDDPFIAFQKLDLHFMTSHSAKYPLLNNRPDDIARIRRYEKAFDGQEVPYIPVALLGASRDVLSMIRDGDIIAIVTRIDGLDASHLGIAFWQNGQLHLLHASSVCKQVTEERRPLYDYMRNNPSQLGIRVLRMQ